jgi:hypothetical protein
MSDTPRTDAKRGFHDLDTAVDAEFSEQLECELNAANERIKRLEELGHELRECASRIGTVASGEASIIRRTQEAIEEWDKEAKL